MQCIMYIYVKDSPVVYTTNVIVFTNALAVFFDLEMQTSIKVPKDKVTQISAFFIEKS